MRFKNYRIPRENMMMKIVEVNKKGEVKIKGDPRVLYGGML
jgi:hypothetical protein